MVSSKIKESIILGNEVAPQPIPIDDSLDHVPEGSYVDPPFIPGLHVFYKSRFIVHIDENISVSSGKGPIKFDEVIEQRKALATDFATMTFDVYSGSKTLEFCGTLEVDNHIELSQEAILDAVKLVKKLKEHSKLEYYKSWPLRNDSGQVWGVIQLAYRFE